MDTNIKIYKVPSDAKDVLNKRMLIMSLAMILFFFLASLPLLLKCHLLSFNFVTGGVITIYGLFLFLILKLSYRSAAKNILNRELKIKNEGLECSLGKSTKSFNFVDFKSVISYKNKEDETLSIMLKTGKTQFFLYQFERMNEILEEIKKKVPADIIKEKTQNLSWYEPNVFLSLFFLVLTIYLLNDYIRGNLVKDAYNFFWGILNIIWGFSWAFFKTLSRMHVDKKLRVFEVIFGLFMIFIGILQIFFSFILH